MPTEFMRNICAESAFCGYSPARSNMTLVELLVFALGAALTVLFGKYFYGKIGWWGVLPAPILGFGSVWGIILLLNWIFPPRASRDLEQQTRDSDPKNI